MAASKRFVNWVNVGFTPSGGSVTHVTGVTSVMIDSGGSLIKFSGDADRYNSTVTNDFNEPTVTVECADNNSVFSLPVGTVGTFTATHCDAVNGLGTGAMTYTMVNAVVSKNPIQGKHRAFGSGTLTLIAYAPDGVTNPLSVSIAT